MDLRSLLADLKKHEPKLRPLFVVLGNCKTKLRSFLTDLKKHKTKLQPFLANLENYKVKTQLWLRPFIDDFKSFDTKTRLGIFGFLFLVVSGLLTWLLSTPAATLVLINTTPYDIRFAVHHANDNGGYSIYGWQTLSPGTQWNVEVDCDEKEPEFYIYSEHLSPKLVALLHPDDSTKYNKLFHTGDRLLPIPEGSSDFSSTSEVPYSFTTEGGQHEASKRFVEFEAIRYPEPGTRNFVWYYRDDKIRTLIEDLAEPIYKNTDLDATDLSCQHARDIRHALDWHIYMENEWGRFVFPVGLHERTQDLNGLHRLGVEITQIPQTESTYASEFAYVSPFKVGDVITKINAIPVFTQWDLLRAVRRHSRSESQGVKVPVIVEYRRGDSAARTIVETTYWFNPAAWPNERKPGKAFFRGAWESFTLGLSPTAIPVAENTAKGLYNGARWLFGMETPEAEYVDISEERWKSYQRIARLRQFHPEDFGWGEFVGFFGSPASIVRGAVIRGGRRSVVKRLSERAVIEVGEMAIYEIATRPATQTDKELREELEYVLPRAAAIGVVAGLVFGGK